MELNMKREDKILKEFSSIYKKGIRKEYDIGDINPLDILANDCQNPADYFITALNPLKDIHIGQPFNLILTNKKDKYFKKGWDSIEDIKELEARTIKARNPQPKKLNNLTLAIKIGA